MHKAPVPIAAATIEGLYWSMDRNSFETAPVSELAIDAEGIIGDARRSSASGYSPYSKAGVRLPGFRPDRTVIARREISIMDTVSADKIGDVLGLPEQGTYGKLGTDRSAAICRVLGANMLLKMDKSSLYDIPNATDFGPVDEAGFFYGATLLITSYNNPCMRPFWRAVEALPAIDHSRGDSYLKMAASYRGVVASPSASGIFVVGQEVAFLPRPVSRATNP